MSKLSKNYNTEALVRYARKLGFGEIHTCIDKETGLHAIIAIHSTKRGPAIGGCRFKTYRSTGAAIKDVIRLGYMMTMKAAVSQLPNGGAKAVILKPKNMDKIDREKLFYRFGQFVDSLNGRYITSLDVGTTTHDMDIIAKATPYVIGATCTHEHDVDPSPHTSLGILRGIQAAVKHQLQKDDLKNIHVAVQGAGHVAYTLIKHLTQLGARVTACDINEKAIQRCVDEFGVTVVDPDKIYDVACDVFAPCALGGIINLETMDQLQTSIIAGSANNQLAHAKYAELLRKKNILYVPDYVINSGGLICASSAYHTHKTETADKQIEALYDTLLEIFKRSDALKQPTTAIADMIAHENLKDIDHEHIS